MTPPVPLSPPRAATPVALASTPAAPRVAPWRLTERVVREVVEVDGRKVTVERTVESRTLGAEELAGHRVEGKCYLRAWVAVTVRVEVAR